MRTTDTRAVSAAQYAVLGLLTLGDASGYDLTRHAARNVDLILAPTKSRIYAVLPALLERGFVDRRDVPQEGRPDKHVYRLTDAGRDAFETWLNDTSSSATREQLLLKLFFGARADAEALLEQVRAFRTERDTQLELFLAIRRENDASPHGFFPNLTVACGIELTRATIRWADETIAALEAAVDS